jgi:hypothetical protein
MIMIMIIGFLLLLRTLAEAQGRLGERDMRVI